MGWRRCRYQARVLVRHDLPRPPNIPYIYTNDIGLRPYTDTYLDVFFDRSPGALALKVPASLLRKSPRLSAAVPDPFIRGICLETSEAVAHVLVHHLYTDTYQCLRPKGSSPHEKLIAEFTTSVQTYVAAQAYELPSLSEQAMGEMERLGSDLALPIVLGVVKEEYPNPDVNDTWFHNYLKSHMKSLFENPGALYDLDFPTGPTVSLAEIILRNAIELRREDVVLVREDSDTVNAAEAGLAEGPVRFPNGSVLQAESAGEGSKKKGRRRRNSSSPPIQQTKAW